MRSKFFVIGVLSMSFISASSQLCNAVEIPQDYYTHPPRVYSIENLKNTLRVRWKRCYYERDFFDCSQMSAYVERYLENKGFNTAIVIRHSSDERVGHAWLLVEVSSGNFVHVESQSFRIISSDELKRQEYEYKKKYKDIYEACDKGGVSEYAWWLRYTGELLEPLKKLGHPLFLKEGYFYLHKYLLGGSGPAYVWGEQFGYKANEDLIFEDYSDEYLRIEVDGYLVNAEWDAVQCNDDGTYIWAQLNGIESPFIISKSVGNILFIPVEKVLPKGEKPVFIKDGFLYLNKILLRGSGSAFVCGEPTNWESSRKYAFEDADHYIRIRISSGLINSEFGAVQYDQDGHICWAWLGHIKHLCIKEKREGNVIFITRDMVIR